MKKSYKLLLGLLSLFLINFYSCTKNPVSPTPEPEPTPDTTVTEIPDEDPLPPTTAENALEHYLKNGDDSYAWTIVDSFNIGAMKGYDVLLTSQRWQDFIWKHQLTILTPGSGQSGEALLFIDGGSNQNGEPNWSSPDDGLINMMAIMAQQNKSTLALLKQVPNQPFYNGLTEDALISYTLHQFNKDQDYSWPLLFPMTKSAVKAMDAVQEVVKKKQNQEISEFVVAGASKRGWATWLTGAMDKRVKAIAPLVIDILNMPVNLAHQWDAYGEYSEQIQDYVDLGIVQGLGTPEGDALVTMIDPYSYRDRLTMPKMIIMGANDPYWVIDNVKNYLPDIPGHNMVFYVPNAGHDLGIGAGNLSALTTLSAFWEMTIQGIDYPVSEWDTEEDEDGVDVHVKASGDRLVGVEVWSAESKDRDFRDDRWSKKVLDIGEKSDFTVRVDWPDTGYRAFYIDLIYKNPGGSAFRISTRAFVTDTGKVIDM